MLLKVYKRYLKQNENEEMNENHISTNAELIVSVLEGMNLQGKGFIYNLSPYLVLRFEEKEQMTSVKENNCNPVWNEDFLL